MDTGIGIVTDCPIDMRVRHRAFAGGRLRELLPFLLITGSRRKLKRTDQPRNSENIGFAASTTVGRLVFFCQRCGQRWHFPMFLKWPVCVSNVTDTPDRFRLMECTHSDGTVVDWSQIHFEPFKTDSYHTMVAGRTEQLMLRYDQISCWESVAHIPSPKDSAAADFHAWEALAYYLANGAQYDRESILLALTKGIRTIAGKEAKKDESLRGAGLRRKIEENFEVGMFAVIEELDRWQKDKSLPVSLDDFGNDEPCAVDMDGDCYVPVAELFGDVRRYLNRVAKHAIMRNDKNTESWVLDDNDDFDVADKQKNDPDDEYDIEKLIETIDDPIHATMLRLKAKGLSHAAIGKIVGRKERTVGKWICHYQELWEKGANLPHKSHGRVKRRGI